MQDFESESCLAPERTLISGEIPLITSLGLHLWVHVKLGTETYGLGSCKERDCT